jgi:hypothetical protein
MRRGVVLGKNVDMLSRYRMGFGGDFPQLFSPQW